MKWYWLLLATLLVAGFLLHAARLVRFDTSLHWTVWIVVALVLLNGGWMTFDGGRALLVGDYITPKTGPHAGMLGPWSRLVQAAGIGPRSTPMKTTFLVYGMLHVGAAVAFVLGLSSAWVVLLALAVLGLWYMPFGTLINLIVIVLLLLPTLRP